MEAELIMSASKKYEIRYPNIEAIQFNGRNNDEIKAFTGAKRIYDDYPDKIRVCGYGLIIDMNKTDFITRATLGNGRVFDVIEHDLFHCLYIETGRLTTL